MYSPHKYARNIGPLMSIAKPLFNKHNHLLKWRSESETILDLGVGDGTITNEVILKVLPNNVKEYVGADISEVMLSAAKQTVNHSKFSTIQLDASTKNLPDELKNRFHHVFSNFCLHVVPDIRQAFVNIRDMLKPGGQLFFNVYEKVCSDEAYELLDKGKWGKYRNRIGISPFYFTENPSKEYETLMKSTDFVDIQVFSEHFAPHLSEKCIEELLAAVNPRLPYVTENDKEEFQKDFIETTKNKTKFVNIIIDDVTKEKIYEMHFDITTGIAFKPL